MTSPADMDLVPTNIARPKTLSGVLVSVGYDQQLSQTLPANINLFDELVVVTTAEDVNTQAIAKAHGAKLVLSNRCFDEDHAFNKGRMMNDGLAALTEPDWIILTDADVTLNPDTRSFVMGRALDPGCLYFTGRRDLAPVANQLDSVNMEPNGYFQMFNPQAPALRARWPKLICEAFCSAGGVDSWFAAQWTGEAMVCLPEISVTHIPSQSLGQNWNGRADDAPAPAGKWRQFGFLTINGFSTFTGMTELPERLKLTDTLYGQTIVIDTADFNHYVRRVADGLEFLGRPIGLNHIHVAHRH